MSVQSTNNRALPHLPYLDGWRGLAIILVLLEHFGGLPTGMFGVQIFFVLSGLLMARILFIQRMNLKTFFIRRFSRIFPIFLIYVIFTFTVFGLLYGKFELGEFLYTSTFLRTYYAGGDIWRANFPIGHIWSLNVEEHSYIFLAAVALLCLKVRDSSAKWAILAAAFCCVLTFIFYKYYPPDAPTRFYLRSEVAAFPLLLSCAAYLWLNDTRRHLPKWVAPLSFCTALTIVLSIQSVFFIYLSVSILLSLSVNSLGSSYDFVTRLLSNQILKWFGRASYSIYIWQQIFYFSHRYFQDVVFYTEYAIVLTLLVASISYYLIECPLRAWLSGRSLAEIRFGRPARKPV